MPLFTKPQFNTVWASTGAKLAPEVAKISQGWVVEIPPHEFDNWMQNRQDALLAHLNQLGIPQWDSTVEYQSGKSYVQGTTTGVVYKAITTHSNVNPETDIQNNWTVAFQPSDTSLLKVNNLADVPDKAQARINLGIATTEFYDGRYLLKSANLVDVPNKATARGNLDVYSRSEVYTKSEVEGLLGTGMIAYFAGTTAPTGWLIANGQAVSRTVYASLFVYIGTMYGPGNGTTTFNLPDLRGEFIRGLDLGRGIDPSRTLGSIQLSQNISHTHVASTDQAGLHNHTSVARDTPSPDGKGIAEGRGNGDWNEPTTDSGLHNHVVTVSASGGSEARPRNIAFLPCIKT